MALYFNRARYLNVVTGRFWSQDDFEGSTTKPLSLHKYFYTNGDPVNNLDPSGTMTLVETTQVAEIRIDQSVNELQKADPNKKPKVWTIYEAFQLQPEDRLFGFHFFIFAGSTQNGSLGYRFDVILPLSFFGPMRLGRISPNSEVPGLVLRTCPENHLHRAKRLTMRSIIAK